jgi:hypothetical protein
LYGPDNVGTSIALNVKELFYVKDVKRVFFNKKIREAGINVDSLKIDAEHLFRATEQRVRQHLG